MANEIDLEKALEVARVAVEKAGASLIRWFESSFEVDLKTDGSPVTEADREAEEVIVRVLRDAFPDHAILGEEGGARAGDAATRWIIDPLDGTARFARGLRSWGPLVALEHEGEVVVGAMGLPCSGESYWAARGLGAFRDGERLRVSEVSRWADANVSVGGLGRLLASERRDGVTRLLSEASYTMAGGDLASCTHFLNGHAEAWIECGVHVWDIAPFCVLVEEAGGLFTDLDGVRTIESGAAVATNRALHEHVLSALRV